MYDYVGTVCVRCPEHSLTIDAGVVAVKGYPRMAAIRPIVILGNLSSAAKTLMIVV